MRNLIQTSTVFQSVAAPLVLATSLTISSLANAGLMLENYASDAPTPEVLGGYQMTDFALSNDTYLGSWTSSVDLPGGLAGEVQFVNRSGVELDMMRSTADNTGWWVNGEDHDYDIFTTHEHWVELLLPENTRAFSFNVGASFSGWGWMVGFNSNNQQHELYETFSVSDENTPGFGVYADNSKGDCGSISSIIIDPQHWGVGNFSINVSECHASVPEPGVMSLLAIGLLGLGLARGRFAETVAS